MLVESIEGVSVESDRLLPATAVIKLIWQGREMWIRWRPSSSNVSKSCWYDTCENLRLMEDMTSVRYKNLCLQYYHHRNRMSRSGDLQLAIWRQCQQISWCIREGSKLCWLNVLWLFVVEKGGGRKMEEGRWWWKGLYSPLKGLSWGNFSRSVFYCFDWKWEFAPIFFVVFLKNEVALHCLDAHM